MNRSILTKFLIWIIPSIIVIILFTGISLYRLESESQKLQIETLAMEVGLARSHEMGEVFNSVIIALQEIAQRPDAMQLDMVLLHKHLKKIVKERPEVYGFFGTMTPDGILKLSNGVELNASKEPYYKDIFIDKKEVSISNPFISRATGKPIFTVNVPIKNDQGDVISSVGTAIYLSNFSEITSAIKVGKSGYAWIIDNNGLVVTHPDTAVVMKLNVLESANEGYVDLDKAGKEMLENRIGISSIQAPGGIKKQLIYSRIPNSPNWSLGISIPQNEIYASVNKLLVNMFFGFLFVTLVIIVLIIFISRNIIIKPLHSLLILTKRIAEGDLSIEVENKNEDEIGRLSESFGIMVNKLRDVVSNIRNNSENISAGSSQISSSSQTIAQGANEQAAATEQVSSSLEEMLSTIEQNSENSTQAQKIATKAEKGIVNGQGAMGESIIAMQEIAKEITRITEIAGQTDMLAINAAIEAARAGEFGKGFSVVASEIRRLAENTQKAATKIIELSENGLKISVKSGDLLKEIVPDVQKTSHIVTEISAASSEQNTGTQMINSAVMQLSKVTQENSSTAEQLASGAEELASQAVVLKDLVSYFTLYKDK